MNIKSIYLVLIYLSFSLIANSQISFSGGTGSSTEPFQISTESDLLQLSIDVNNGEPYAGIYFILTENLNLSEIPNWTPIGGPDTGWTEKNPFSGYFDGNKKTIKNMSITNSSRSWCYGLFGILSSEGVIANLGVIDVNILLTYSNSTGVLVEKNYGSIINCYGTGVIGGNGGGGVGGLAGHNDQTGFISNSYASVNVFSIEYTNDYGGLVGYNYGKITNSYATGPVTITGNSVGVGAFAGYSAGSISNCYAAGLVTEENNKYQTGGFIGTTDTSLIIRNCYFDPIKTGQTVGIGWSLKDEHFLHIIPKTTAEFTSGEVSWLLQGGEGNGQSQRPASWGQFILDESNYPTLDAFDSPTDSIHQVHLIQLNYQEDGKLLDTIYIRNGIEIGNRLPPLVKSGYIGTWNTSSDGSGKVYSADTLGEQETILYAVWENSTNPTPENYLKVTLNDFYFKCYTTDPVVGDYFIKEGDCFTFKFVYEDCCVVPYEFKPDVIANKDTIYADAEGNYSICDIREALDIRIIPNEKPVANESLADEIQIWSSNGLLHITCENKEIITVYNITGQLVLQTKLAAGDHTFTLSKGLYLVKTEGGKVVKVQL